jgi:hypothetical protein
MRLCGPERLATPGPNQINPSCLDQAAAMQHILLDPNIH